MNRIAKILLACAVITGCTDTAVFVTKSSLAIDVDPQAQSASVGYDRTEGFIGPRYGNGQAPAVLASIKTDGALISPEIKQLYATGKAAVLLASRGSTTDAAEMSGEKRLMFVGTSTNTGVKIGFANNAPEFTFGFKRKEFSSIPLASNNGKDIYPSAVAALDTKASAGKSGSDSNFLAWQYFATGLAAEELAKRASFQDAFDAQAADALAIYHASEAAQNAEAVTALQCLIKVKDADLPALVVKADDLKILGTPSYLPQIQSLLASNTPEATQRARTIYAGMIGISVGKDTDREKRLFGHQLQICETAKK
jgi:hypothetical protein